MVEIIIDMAYADKYLESMPETILYTILTSIPMGTAKKSKFIVSSYFKGSYPPGLKG